MKKSKWMTMFQSSVSVMSDPEEPPPSFPPIPDTLAKQVPQVHSN